jgi:hypothetical protein
VGSRQGTSGFPVSGELSFLHAEIQLRCIAKRPTGKMEYFHDSQVAVEAMAALQTKIKELQSENDGLRQQATELRTLAQERESLNLQRDQTMAREADKAQQMMESAAETMIELRRIRTENRHLENELGKLRIKLTTRQQAEAKYKREVDSSLADLKHSELLQSEIEELFAMLLSPPEFPFEGRMNVVFNQTIKSITTHSLPATLQTVLCYLQRLPTQFREQKPAVKKEIVRGLRQARDICCRMVSEIHMLEISKLGVGAKKRVQGEISAKTAQLYVLSQAMGRFTFA